MTNAPALSEPFSKPRQGIGARLARGFGGVVRKAFAVLSHPRCRQPRAAAPAGGNAPASRPGQSSLSRKRQPRPAPAASVAPPARRGWLARCFGLRRGPRPASRPCRSPDAPFTPETCPGLTAEDCAFLNTPVEDCDPEVLRQLLGALAQRIAAILPPDSGIADAQAMFAMLWTRLGAPAAQPDATAAPQQQPAGQALSRRPSRHIGSRRRRPAAATGDAGRAALALPGHRRRARHRVKLWDFPAGNHAPRRTAPGTGQRLGIRRLCYAARASPP
ncbi:MAG TPA: hypothetical protein VFN42_03555 [Acetobacteraceae bacterium]|nr:hypothetical protein [Acetobacteraceae bacterium]